MGANEETLGSAIAASPIKNKVGSYFVPVRNIEASRSWYCKVLGLSEDDCPIHFGHLCPLPMQGTGLILDTMPRWGGGEPDGAPSILTPAFMLLTDKLEESLAYMKELGARLVTEIEHGQWFVVLDPDGNKLMICRNKQEAPSLPYQAGNGASCRFRRQTLPYQAGNGDFPEDAPLSLTVPYRV